MWKVIIKIKLHKQFSTCIGSDHQYGIFIWFMLAGGGWASPREVPLISMWIFKCLNLCLWTGASWSWSCASVLEHFSTVPGNQREALLLLGVFVRRLQLLVCEQCPALIWFFWQLKLSYAGWGPVCVWFQSCAAFLWRLVYFCAPKHCPVYDICIKSPVKWKLWEKVLFSKLPVYIDSVKH